jgi:hypothetical protein
MECSLDNLGDDSKSFFIVQPLVNFFEIFTCRLLQNLKKFGPGKLTLIYRETQDAECS